MAEKSPMLLEVTVTERAPTSWKWLVCDHDVEITWGFEPSREMAQISGDTALFDLLSEGLTIIPPI